MVGFLSSIIILSMLFFTPVASAAEGYIAYESQKYGYTVEVPSDWEIITEEGHDLAIRNKEIQSIFSVQVVENTDNPSFRKFFDSLVELERKDENHKMLSFSFSEDFYGKGLASGSMLWLQENNEVKSKTVLTSRDGMKNVYIFKFYSLAKTFDENEAIFERILRSFSRTGVQAVPREKVLPMPAPEKNKEPDLPKDKWLTNTFKKKGFGYTIKYPKKWEYTRPSTFTVVFGGAKDTEAYNLSVSIQNLASAKIGGKYESLDSVLEDFKNQIRSGSEGVIIYNEEPYLYKFKKLELSGRQFTAEYVSRGEKFKEWVIVVPREGGEAFYAWSYTAPLGLYDAYLHVAEAMKDSWQISKSDGKK